jgi:hypothetical protein
MHREKSTGERDRNLDRLDRERVGDREFGEEYGQGYVCVAVCACVRVCVCVSVYSSKVNAPQRVCPHQVRGCVPSGLCGAQDKLREALIDLYADFLVANKEPPIVKPGSLVGLGRGAGNSGGGMEGRGSMSEGGQEWGQ